MTGLKSTRVVMDVGKGREREMAETKPHKWAKVIKAWADGNPIQFKVNGFSDWVDYDPDALRNSQASAHFFPFSVPRFDLDFEWRVKPENIIRDACIRLVGTFDNLNPSLFILETPTVRFEFDPDTYKLVKAEVIR